MLTSLKQWVRFNPWRLAAIVLGLGLVGSVVALALLLWGGEEPIATFEPIVTTVVTEPGETTTILGAAEGPPLSVDPNAPTEGLGSAYVSIKVDNAPEARPQVGLAGVPLLVEYPVEGGITRFTAVVNRDVTGGLGPVRSLRPVDADLLPQLARTWSPAAASRS